MPVRYSAYGWRLECQIGNSKKENLVGLYEMKQEYSVPISANPMIFSLLTQSSNSQNEASRYINEIHRLQMNAQKSN